MLFAGASCDDRPVATSDLSPDRPDPRPEARPDVAGSLGAPVRKLYRRPEGRVVGGVASGLAAHLGIPVLWVRAAFVVLTLGQGLGLVLYAAFWFVVPMGGVGGAGASGRPVGGPESGDPGSGRPPGGLARARRSLQALFRGDPSPEGQRAVKDRGRLLALIAVLAGVLVLVNVLTAGRDDPYFWPVLISGAGVALVWRQVDDARWARWFSLDDSSKGAVTLRLGAGVVLVAAGVISFLVVSGSLAEFGKVMQAVLVVLAGVLLLAGPYLLRMWQDLTTERRERIRAQERAEVAAHIHDSVLHTLTLILRHADDPKEVARLARAQERDLRQWLYRSGDPKDETTPDTLAESVRAVAAEVEDHHGVPVEVICVGDAPMDERLAAQLQAAREAMVNAAKYGGGEPVSVYAEVEGSTVWVFVRDRGPGFDLDAVPEDRMGVRGSIIGRMQRNGGHARVRPAPAGGTEVELEMERASG
ncbi:signal transduction histidine kinase/phage shock protein PspC (stress-responsive transcriptional regulator) [Streptacidiphilus sp. MAP12-20]|uniref:ATP-binding protein n=1 Tax=Streptacidiphilus sp. MAP12-20 TaxID=3156299 RepID=UPI003518AB85